MLKVYTSLKVKISYSLIRFKSIDKPTMFASWYKTAKEKFLSHKIFGFPDVTTPLSDHIIILPDGSQVISCAQ